MYLLFSFVCSYKGTVRHESPIIHWNNSILMSTAIFYFSFPKEQIMVCRGGH
jgi:hypothetical protein